MLVLWYLTKKLRKGLIPHPVLLAGREPESKPRQSGVRVGHWKTGPILLSSKSSELEVEVVEIAVIVAVVAAAADR